MLPRCGFSSSLVLSRLCFIFFGHGRSELWRCNAVHPCSGSEKGGRKAAAPEVREVRVWVVTIASEVEGRHGFKVLTLREARICVRGREGSDAEREVAKEGVVSTRRTRRLLLVCLGASPSKPLLNCGRNDSTAGRMVVEELAEGMVVEELGRRNGEAERSRITVRSLS